MKLIKKEHKYDDPEDGSCWTSWVYQIGPNESGLTKDDIIWLLGLERTYNGPGQYFCHEPSVTIKEDKVYIEQFSGLDI
jgi:hypothetical protein